MLSKVTDSSIKIDFERLLKSEKRALFGAIIAVFIFLNMITSDVIPKEITIMGVLMMLFRVVMQVFKSRRLKKISTSSQTFGEFAENMEKYKQFSEKWMYGAWAGLIMFLVMVLFIPFYFETSQYFNLYVLGTFALLSPLMYYSYKRYVKNINSIIDRLKNEKIS